MLGASSAYDAKKRVIQNLVNVGLLGRTRPEESLQYAVFNQGLKSAIGATVNKPSCNFDGNSTDDASPTTVVVPSSIAPSNAEEIAWTAHATDTTGVSTVIPVEPTTGSTLFFSTKCASR